MRKRFAIIIPARGRASNVERLVRAAVNTADNVHLYFAIDDDDLETYKNVSLPALTESSNQRVVARWLISPRWSMNDKLNFWAPQIADEYEYIGFLGDDNVPITDHWDTFLCDAIGSRPGVSYADDLIKGADLCTSAVLSSSIVRCLGYMTPKTLTHLYVDNFWMILGQKLNNITYLPDVVVEHRHYTAGKAEQDEQYSFVNSSEMYSHDLTAFQEYVTTTLDKDVQKILNYVEKYKGEGNAE
jgi:hypothetical protein